MINFIIVNLTFKVKTILHQSQLFYFVYTNIMEEKAKVVYIHWWETFRNDEDFISFLKNKTVSIKDKKRRHDDLKDKLKDYCKMIKPEMPLRQKAEYRHRKIWFERYFDFLDEEVILIGGSLWGMFLAKYLSGNKFPKKIISLYLVCPPFDGSNLRETLCWWFNLQDDLSLIEQNCKNITLMFSTDDDVVPISHSKKYKAKLPNANLIVYESKKWHFRIEEFPEIFEMIKEDLK